MRQSRGQIGIEVMAIIGFMILLMLPLIYALLTQAGSFNEGAAVAKAAENVARLAAVANQVGGMGPGSKVVVQVDMPEGVTAASASALGEPYGGELSFTLNTRAGLTQVVSMSDFDLKAGARISELTKPGTHYVVVESMGNPQTECPNAPNGCVRIAS